VLAKVILKIHSTAAADGMTGILFLYRFGKRVTDFASS
jgi:hypothetical protein